MVIIMIIIMEIDGWKVKMPSGHFIIGSGYTLDVMHNFLSLDDKEEKWGIRIWLFVIRSTLLMSLRDEEKRKKKILRR